MTTTCRILSLLTSGLCACQTGTIRRVDDGVVDTTPQAPAAAGASASDSEALPNPTPNNTAPSDPSLVAGAGSLNGPSFVLDLAQPQLLPFNTRLRRVAGVVGLPVEDPLFDSIRAKRELLDDHNYAEGIIPTGLWIASRINTWVEALRPVCDSPAMHQRYAALPADLTALLTSAWGRPPSSEELEDFATSAQPSATADELYRVLCLSALSSAEFVFR